MDFVRALYLAQEVITLSRRPLYPSREADGLVLSLRLL